MALPNTRIVRRSWGLIQQQSRLSSLSSTSGSDSQNPQDANTLLTYGEEFDYSEFMQMSGKASAWLWSAVLGVSMGLIYVLPPVSQFNGKPNIHTDRKCSIPVILEASLVLEEIHLTCTRSRSFFRVRTSSFLPRILALCI